MSEVETAPDEVKSPTEAEPVRSLEVDTAYSDKGSHYHVCRFIFVLVSIP